MFEIKCTVRQIKLTLYSVGFNAMWVWRAVNYRVNGRFTHEVAETGCAKPIELLSFHEWILFQSDVSVLSQPRNSIVRG